MSDKTSDVEFSSAPSPHLSKVITEINSSVDSPKYTDDSVSLHFSEFNDSSEASSAKNDGLKGDSEGKRESKTRSFTKMFYSPTSLFMFATGLALVITGYRYSSYEALKGYREDCRAIAVSHGQRALCSRMCTNSNTRHLVRPSPKNAQKCY